jgi:hypothetical protein
MSDVYYWTLTHINAITGKQYYFAFINKGESLPTNPAMAMRWSELEGAQQFAKRLLGLWTPVLIRFDGDALCGGAEKPSPNSTL